MNCLPSIRQLDAMSPISRLKTIDTRVVELLEKRRGILSGEILPWGGASRGSTRIQQAPAYEGLGLW
jgi:hypothetical protein